jgi:hypothetical protein
MFSLLAPPYQLASLTKLPEHSQDHCNPAHIVNTSHAHTVMKDYPHQESGETCQLILIAVYHLAPMSWMGNLIKLFEHNLSACAFPKLSKLPQEQCLHLL